MWGNFILMFFQELPSLSTAVKPFSSDLEGYKIKKVTPQRNTDFSKLVNLCLVKMFSLILTLYILFWKTPGILGFVILLLENKLSPLQILQNCVSPLVDGISSVKNRNPWKFHEFFMNIPGNSTSFLIDT